MDTKACLRTELCKSKKLCSGEASTYEEAAAMCDKRPAKKLTCDDRNAKALKDLEKIRLNIQEGQADTLAKDVGRITADIKACTVDQNVITLANKLLEDAKGISGQYYYSNEGKGVIKSLDALKQEMGIQGAKQEARGASEESPSPAMSAYMDTEPKRVKPRTVPAAGLGHEKPDFPSFSISHK